MIDLVIIAVLAVLVVLVGLNNDAYEIRRSLDIARRTNEAVSRVEASCKKPFCVYLAACLR